ncbi:MAG TPA: S8 family serine peptidase [Clostridia bacterium]|nr:S8 family serine peptidase [Clostridia bacterium]
MKKSLKYLLLLVIFGLVGCTRTQTVVETEITPRISRYPSAIDFKGLHGKLETLPKYDENSSDNWQLDVRSTDLSLLDLHDRLTDLLHADFDSETKWSDKLPENFDPMKIMELGKDPGLNIRELHKQGITGKGVSVAIIDQTLLVDHKEYADRVRFYEEINIRKDEEAQMHGPAVTSIAVGETVGVAPEAELYYIAETHGTYKKDGFDWDFTYLAQSIDRILEINKSLPIHKKIRVISISVGWSQDEKGYKEVTEAVERAKKEGIFVISSSLQKTYGLKFSGLGRDSLSDPNNFNDCRPGSFWMKRYFAGTISLEQDTLLVPMDSRCTASPTGQEDYVFYSQGGWSWSIPYIAGLYALSCQVDSSITPEVFWKKALETGTTIDIEKNGKIFKLGKIVDPAKLIKSFEKN